MEQVNQVQYDKLRKYLPHNQCIKYILIYQEILKNIKIQKKK